jgi:hypothetical protein
MSDIGNWHFPNWHPDYCKKVLDAFEHSSSDDMVLFRKLRGQNISFDYEFNAYCSNDAITEEELELYKIMVAKRFLITQQMNKKLAIQKKMDAKNSFLKVDGRRVCNFHCAWEDDFFCVYFQIIKNERSFFEDNVHVKAQLKYNDSVLLSESYLVGIRKTKFQRLPKEAKQIMVKVKEDIDYVYELFSKQ